MWPVLACLGWRRCDVPFRIVSWQRRSAQLWMVCGLFAIVSLLWGGRRLARGIDGRNWRAIEEFGEAIAPLLLFALIWLLADSSPRPKAEARLSEMVRSG
jgi:hypothetical protein